jgi:general secretion pathway protein G
MQQADRSASPQGETVPTLRYAKAPKSALPPRRTIWLFMAVALMGLLTFVSQRWKGPGSIPRCATTREIMDGVLAMALNRYRADVGDYPRNADGGLVALFQAPADEDAARRWHGPYVRNADSIRDPWCYDFIYKYPGEHNGSGYDLSSPGPDGEEGTDDDITNWEGP